VKKREYDSINDALRTEIRNSPKSQVIIAEAAGLDKSGLGRFMRGTNLRTDMADRLLRYFEIKLVTAQRRGK
jgi:hypothetical protein